MNKIILDLNSPVFQKDLFSLNKDEAYSLLKTLISQLIAKVGPIRLKF